MNRLFTRTRRFVPNAFTLVELLVVIAIIAILAAVVLGVGNTVINQAKRAKAANTATQIQTACLSYYTEYSVYPVPTGTAAGDYLVTDVAGMATSWQSLIYALSGNVHPSTSLATPAPSSVTPNTRGISFLSLKSSDVDTSDAPLNPLPTGTEIYFNIAIDNDYDGILGVTPSSVTTMPKFTGTFSSTGGGSSTAGVAVWANCNNKTTLNNPSFWVHTY